MNILFLIIYSVGVALILYAIFHKKKESMSEKEDMAMFFACELTNAVWLMTKEQYHDQLIKWKDAYGDETMMGDALAKESFDLAESFIKEMKARRCKKDRV